MVLLVVFLMLGINTVSLRADEKVSVLQAQAHKESFVMKKLQGFIEAQAYSSKHGSTVVKKQPDAFADQVSLAVGRVAAVGIIVASGIVHWPPKTWLSLLLDSITIACGVVAVGYWFDWVCNPIVKFFIARFYQLLANDEEDAFVCANALTEFVRHWNEFKLHAPRSLYAQFDALYLEYLHQGARLKIKEEDAKTIINNVMTSCFENQKQKVAEAAG